MAIEDSGAKILIVEDSATQLRIVSRFLRSLGYEHIVGASSGVEAVEYCAEHEFDLVLMDLHLPDSSGIVVCRSLKETRALEDTPVIVLTASGSSEELEQAFDAGAMDFIVKPPDPVAFAARVRSALRLKREIDGRKRHEEQLMEHERQLLAMTAELAAANEKLFRSSREDPLTGLANRRSFDEALTRNWKRCSRDEAPVSLITLDIDRFKQYNDHYGHPQGDLCLQAVAATLRSCAQRAEDLSARVGGEEFAVLLPDTPALGARHVAERARRAIEAAALPHELSEFGVVTASIGVATCPAGHDSAPQMLIAAADAALYEAKRNGRNRVHFAGAAGAAEVHAR